MLVGLESYYRGEIPRQKLFDQIASDVYVSDERLWQIYKDRHDSAQVSYVLLRPESSPIRPSCHGRRNRAILRTEQAFDRPGRAVVSLLSVARTVTAARFRRRAGANRPSPRRDRRRASFERSPKRESNDTISGAGALGKITRVD
jgi:peptidyl-prolyl cis-trans isomerase D